MDRATSLALLVFLAACASSSNDAGEAGGSGGAGGDRGVAACVDNVCDCTEAGIRRAVADGGGPFTFDCGEPTTVTPEAEIIIDNDVILDGDGALTIDGGGIHRVFSVAESVAVELHGMTITNGFSDRGGGISNQGTLTLTRCTVSGNTVEIDGGGILNDGTLTLSECTVSGNIAVLDSGGGIENRAAMTMSQCTVSENIAGVGAGIWNGGSLAMADSNVSGNTAGSWGGGIRNDDGVLTMTRCTVAGNTAVLDSGGGIDNRGVGMMSQCTVSGNSGGAYWKGGGSIDNAGILTIVASTLSGNASDDEPGILNQETLTLTGSVVQAACVSEFSFPDPIVSNGHNIESPGDTCGFDQTGDQAGVGAEDLKLGELGDNGGPTQTHALGEGSVALDQVPESECLDAEGEPLATDQRGQPRDSMCDVGAFELQP